MKKNPLSKHAMVLVILLVIQYILGMSANLFVQFPDNASEGQLWEFAWTQIPVVLHIIVAIMLLFGSLALIIRAIRYHDKVWIKSSIWGFLGILVAGVAGAIFITSQTDAYSYTMALAFIVAMIAFGWGLYQTKK